MAATLKKLYQGQLPSSVGTLWTPGAGKTHLVKALRISNTDNSASHYFTLYDGGTAAANEILGQMTLQPNEVYLEDMFLVLAAGIVFAGVADVASMVTLTAYGVELS